MEVIDAWPRFTRLLSRRVISLRAVTRVAVFETFQVHCCVREFRVGLPDQTNRLAYDYVIKTEWFHGASCLRVRMLQRLFW